MVGYVLYVLKSELSRSSLQYVANHKLVSLQLRQPYPRLEPWTASFLNQSTLMCCIYNYAGSETFWVKIYKVHLDQFAKMIIVFRVGTPYPILFGNLIQQCMVERPTISRLVHDIWTRFQQENCIKLNLDVMKKKYFKYLEYQLVMRK